MVDFILVETVFYFFITISVFCFWKAAPNLGIKLPTPPLVLSVLTLIPFLLVFNIDYENYMQGAKFIDYLIEPAVVALGFPLYKQWPEIRRQWQGLLAVCCMSVFFLLTYTTLVAQLFDLEDQIILSLAPLNITTAIAMETAENMGGDASLAACFVIMGGMTGSAMGLKWLTLMRIKAPRSRGVSMGVASHALGAASVARESTIGAAYASIALIFCAILTAFIAPYWVPFLLGL